MKRSWKTICFTLLVAVVFALNGLGGAFAMIDDGSGQGDTQVTEPTDPPGDDGGTTGNGGDSQDGNTGTQDGGSNDASQGSGEGTGDTGGDTGDSEGQSTGGEPEQTTQALSVQPPQEEVSQTVQPVAEPNLTISKSASPASGSTVQPGDTITYTLNYANDGEGDASFVIMQDSVPAGATFVSATGGALGPTSTGQVIWVLGAVTSGTSGSVSLTVQVDDDAEDGLQIQNQAFIDNVADEAPNSSSNVTVHSVVSDTQPPITITKSANPPSGSEVEPGDEITYTITVEYTPREGYDPEKVNPEGKDMTISVDDAIPGNTTLVDDSISDEGTETNGTITWNVINPFSESELTTPKTWTFEFKVKVDEDAPDGTEIRNVATLEGYLPCSWHYEGDDETIHYVKVEEEEKEKKVIEKEVIVEEIPVEIEEVIPQEEPVEVVEEPVEAAEEETLPHTGINLILWLATALGLMVVGMGMRRR